MSSVDIVVTIPAARLASVEEEERVVEARIAKGEKAGPGGWQYFWEMRRIPKAVPRRIYFVWHGAVRAWHEVLGMVKPDDGCFEHYSGMERNQDLGAIYMHPTINAIEPILMRPFRGFRYFDEAGARETILRHHELNKAEPKG